MRGRVCVSRRAYLVQCLEFNRRQLRAEDLLERGGGLVELSALVERRDDEDTHVQALRQLHVGAVAVAAGAVGDRGPVVVAEYAVAVQVHVGKGVGAQDFGDNRRRAVRGEADVADLEFR